MKQLSELGISPMPWGLDYNTKEYVIDSVEDNVCYVDGDTIEQAYANAHMLKAAPKMYEALRELYLISIEPVGGTREEREKQSEQYENALYNARAALMEASGE